MAKGKYTAWLEPSQLEKLTNWAANGCTDDEIAHNMGIARSTFYEWMPKHTDISDAIKKGREMAVETVENTFFKRALGLCEEVTTTSEVEQRMVDGELVTVQKYVKKTTRQLAPDTTALIFYLKNKAGYKNEPESPVKVEVAPMFVYERADD